ncbi:MAG: thymidine kinase [Chitinophagaceae bacterium]|jgi:thymidine kinase
MFIEPNNSGVRRGSIEVICGSMFSGKTEELIRRLKRVRIANQVVAVFKPQIDVRFSSGKIVSHDTNSIHSTPVGSAKNILEMIGDAEVVGIDEAQFFDTEIADVCDMLAFRGIRVIVAGLDMDYLGKPFGAMPFIMSKADYVTKLHAICQRCGSIANYSYRKVTNEEQVMLGATDSYEPRCRKCYQES